MQVYLTITQQHQHSWAIGSTIERSGQQTMATQKWPDPSAPRSSWHLHRTDLSISIWPMTSIFYFEICSGLKRLTKIHTTLCFLWISTGHMNCCKHWEWVTHNFNLILLYHQQIAELILKSNITVFSSAPYNSVITLNGLLPALQAFFQCGISGNLVGNDTQVLPFP